MTANILYQNALSLMITKKSDETDYTQYAVMIINSLLAETFIANNSIRVYMGLNALDTIPQITALTDEIPYEDSLVLMALPYGICAKLMVDTDMNKVVYYHNLYSNFVNDCAKASRAKITDIYRGNEHEAN